MTRGRLRSLEEVVAGLARIEAAEIRDWIEAGLLAPQCERGAYRFSEVDAARVTLIAEIRHDLGVEPETLPLVLSLLDQIYEARGQMQAILAAIGRQPETVRDAIRQSLQELREEQ